MIKYARLLFGLVISGLCLWLVMGRFLGGANIVFIMEKMEDISVMWVALAIGILILIYPLNALRLNYILSFDKASSCNFSQVLSIVWASSFLSLAVPSAAFSDGIRAALLRATRMSNLSLSVRAVIIDRFIGLIYTLGLAGILLLIPYSNINPAISNYWGLVFLSVFMGTVAVIFLGSKLVNNIQLFVNLRNLFNGTRRLMNNPGALVLFLGFSVANTIISALSLWCLARGFSVTISFWIFFVFTPAILIVNNLPFFYQGFGGREAAMLFAFSNYPSAMSPDLVVTISLLSGAVMMVSALVGSIFVPFIIFRRNNLPVSLPDYGPQNAQKETIK
jgi:uncharacterized membrane protein YbhN (UPF0104 family)